MYAINNFAEVAFLDWKKISTGDLVNFSSVGQNFVPFGRVCINH